MPTAVRVLRGEFTFNEQVQIHFGEERASIPILPFWTGLLYH